MIESKSWLTVHNTLINLVIIKSMEREFLNGEIAEEARVKKERYTPSCTISVHMDIHFESINIILKIQ